MRTASTMWFKLIAIALLPQVRQPALAQIERYDPSSGKYVTSDPFARPTPSAPSPYRLNPRISQNGVSQFTPSTQQTHGIALPGAAESAAVPAKAASELSQPLVSMGGMAMYGDDTSSAEPFATPDWWPQ